MNRSFSKIRHIQEVNQRLEKRLISEQPIFSSAAEMFMDLGKDIGSHPHVHGHGHAECDEKFPDRDYAFNLIKWALSSNVGTNSSGTYYGDVDQVHNDVISTSTGSVIIDTIKKLTSPESFVSFVKSYYNRPGYKTNGKLDLFKDLDSKDKMNPMFGWDDVVKTISGEVKKASGVNWCKKVKRNDIRDLYPKEVS
jgi:hypothetical protein